MDISDIKKVAVLGAGTMGLGIANVFAMKGFSTILYDISDEALDKAKTRIDKNLEGAVKRGKLSQSQKEDAMRSLTFTSKFDDLKADFIVEAVLEKLELKVDIFTKLIELNGESTIFATNTSTIPITKIAAQLSRPEKLVGMHFFNPAHIMKLVEVISGAGTSENVARITYELCEKLGKKPVMANDSPGFIVNRVARHFYVESLKTLEEGVADHEGIDRLIEATGFKMGPFKLMDLIGVETNFAVTKTMYESFHFDSKFRPSRIQEKKVFAGHFGKKSGKGFYEYKQD